MKDYDNLIEMYSQLYKNILLQMQTVDLKGASDGYEVRTIMTPTPKK